MKERKKDSLEPKGSLLEAAISAASALIKDIPDGSYKKADDPFLLARAKAENIGHLAATIFETIQARLGAGPDDYVHSSGENCAFPCRKPGGK